MPSGGMDFDILELKLDGQADKSDVSKKGIPIEFRGLKRY